MTDELISAVAENLKNMNNTAVELIRNGRFDEAQRMYEMSDAAMCLLNYTDGIAMVRISLANLAAMQGDFVSGLDYAETVLVLSASEDFKKEAKDLCGRIAKHVLKAGMTEEESGDMKMALKFFEKAAPHLGEKRAALVYREIELIRSHITQND